MQVGVCRDGVRVWRWGMNVGGGKSVRVWKLGKKTMANYAHSLLYMLWLVPVQPSSSVGVTHTKDTAIIVKYYVCCTFRVMCLCWLM